MFIEIGPLSIEVARTGQGWFLRFLPFLGQCTVEVATKEVAARGPWWEVETSSPGARNIWCGRLNIIWDTPQSLRRTNEA